MEEIWKDISGLEGLYQISNLGNLKSLSRKTKRGYLRGDMLRSIRLNKGYQCVMLFNKGKRKLYFIHRLIGIYFIPNPEQKGDINHKNGIRHDNRIENLEWATRSENLKHAFDILGRKKEGKKIIQFNAEKKKIKEWNTIKEAAQELFLNESAIVSCCKHRIVAGYEIKSHGGFLWEYAPTPL